MDLLQQNWNSSNTFSETPSIIYAEWDNPPSKPYVNVEQPTEGPINGGDTGFDGIDPSGNSPHQTISGTVPIHLFASNTELDNATTDNARKYLTGIAESDGTINGGAVEEVYRIVRNNSVNPTNPKTGNNPIDLLSASSFNKVPEPDEPQTFHYAGEIQYIYSTA